VQATWSLVSIYDPRRASHSVVIRQFAATSTPSTDRRRAAKRKDRLAAVSPESDQSVRPSRKLKGQRLSWSNGYFFLAAFFVFFAFFAFFAILPSVIPNVGSMHVDNRHA
jgi:hypothetical protein